LLSQLFTYSKQNKKSINLYIRETKRTIIIQPI